ncbi:hypothetical protein Dtox_3894 [Desulfofarcimen acetoxidans DSM 771]|uniref:Uncharacterized protein n=1 Tax=Desulfofarcimen acetoxidans (strain ATCC 49208 / DSM 771 / KCTC 5769 / VKM B-1644 / 5575) TaxID=485916 RepID=C8VXV9_DESAS|nr:hypothetical protein [Desulfofarcimen acetoxidans]ACV64588.1 hypothetical protein Dtox_3894 [Desulfofarcimen acetoxidans DSM 771]
MSGVIDYRDVMTRYQKELDDFLNEMDELAKFNGTSLEEELECLDPIELQYFERLEKRLAKLQQWDAVNENNKAGQSKKRKGNSKKNEDSSNR